MIFGKAQRI